MLRIFLLSVLLLSNAPTNAQTPPEVLPALGDCKPDRTFNPVEAGVVMVPRPKVSDVEVDYQTLVGLKKAPQSQFLGWWTWRLIGYEYPSLVPLETIGYGPQKPGPNMPTQYLTGSKTIEQARVRTCEEYRRLAVPVYTADTMKKAFDALEQENKALRAVLRTAASDAAALSARVNALGSQIEALRADISRAKPAVAASGTRRGQASQARQ